MLGGIKVGKRFENWGVFIKARPGIVSFSQGNFEVVQSGGSGSFPFVFQTKRLTTFAMDVGPVLEFYPSKRIVTRFDAGDTLFRFGRRTTKAFRFDPLTGMFDLVPFTIPARTIHNFQFTASVGFRF